ncbi:MAG: hypothetical protein WDM76_11850 [Limisphaerales bacterium]
MTEIKTNQQDIEDRIKSRNEALISASAPESAEKIANLHEQADEIQEQAQAEFDAQASAIRSIETLLLRQSVILYEIDNLRYLLGVNGARKVNARQALDYFLQSKTVADGYSTQNWIALTDEMTRAEIVAPFIPEMIKEREVELESNRSEIDGFATARKIDVKALAEALHKQSAIHEKAVYSLNSNQSVNSLN